ncbi:hypothetical protein C0Q70_12964 [Pomacea canaliculata]|uniref:Uncharacterized protein n=1 Tax=Pomacea canaliculata TaxID=400727 RepID=A0A2T7P2Z8_POMCA|nr:hypothetical protein C0Q70_12964 [Pomacea canaliculata]
MTRVDSAYSPSLVSLPEQSDTCRPFLLMDKRMGSTLTHVTSIKDLFFRNNHCSSYDYNNSIYTGERASGPAGGPRQENFNCVAEVCVLTVLPHHFYKKALYILRVVGHVSCGADRTVLLCLYCALVRCKLDYGAIIYGSARESHLKISDPIHHQGLRICLGAFRTTPIQSLYAEAGEPQLSFCRLKLMLSYVCRLKARPGNPGNHAVFGP